MSKSYTPTDNSVQKIKMDYKKAIYIDFDIKNYNIVNEFIKDVVKDNNKFRSSHALNYNPIKSKNQLGFKQLFFVYTFP